MDEILLAPCGMNCGICSRYLALKYDVRNQGLRMAYCTGCRPRDRKCAFLKKRCPALLNGEVKYCSECMDFPCQSLRHLDARYRANFRMSMIDNLELIKKEGVARLLEREAAIWKCARCGGIVCCHNGVCFSCELDRLKARKNLYRWEE
jgi:hypothetical protein